MGGSEVSDGYYGCDAVDNRGWCGTSVMEKLVHCVGKVGVGGSLVATTRIPLIEIITAEVARSLFYSSLGVLHE